MSSESTIDHLSRRGLLAAFGAAAATGAAVAIPGTTHASALPIGKVAAPETLNAPTASFLYQAYDAFSLRTTNPAVDQVVYQELTGIQPLTPATNMYAPIDLPAGSVLKELNFAYQVQPIPSITKRSFTSPTPPTDVFGPVTLAPGGGPKTQSLTIPNGGVTLAGDASYYVKIFFSAGDSIYGFSIGYVPPTQTFVPFTGTTPRVYDSRVAGGILAAGEDRTIPVGATGFRSAVFNLAVDATTPGTPGAGFVGAYSAAKATWPGNASINWDAKGALVSNSVICAVDGAGAIKLHGGVSAAHVVIDLIGFLL